MTYFLSLITSLSQNVLPLIFTIMPLPLIVGFYTLCRGDQKNLILPVLIPGLNIAAFVNLKCRRVKFLPSVFHVYHIMLAKVQFPNDSAQYGVQVLPSLSRNRTDANALSELMA
jgi:hypothetical protein